MNRLLFILLTALVFASCTNDDSYDLEYFSRTYGNNSSSGTGTDTTTVVPEADTLFVSIVYADGSATLSGDVDKVSISQNGADVTLTSTTDKFLQLTLSGNCADGSLMVYSQKMYGIVLGGLQLTNPDGPAINNQCSKALYFTLADNTENVLTDGEVYAEAPLNAQGKSIDQKATLFSEGQIYFQGTGTLTVNGNAKNGIASDDYIVFEDGIISVSVSDTGSNGVKANDGLTISGGTLTIGVTADGARGIRCDNYTTITGGNTTITTKGDCKLETTDEGELDASSAAGIKCDSLFTMSGGTLTITSSGDGGKGINCSSNVEVSGGTLTITTTGGNEDGKPKGIKSDTAIIVSGGSLTVNVKKSWACDNGVESEEPADRLTVLGSPKTCTLGKRSVVVSY